MNVKVTIAAVVVLLAGMAGLILVSDPAPENTGPVGLWPDFASADVTEISWVGSLGRVRARRASGTRDEWEVETGGHWVPAEALTVESLLVEIGRTEVLRHEPGDTVDAGLRKEWGLIEPGTNLTFTLRGQPVKLSFGGAALGRDAVYAIRDGSDDVYVVSDDLLETLREANVNDLRKRRILPWTVADVDRVEVRRGDTVVFAAARRENDRFIWWAETPFADYLTEELERGILAATLRLEATDFVADDADEAKLAECGLAEPAWRITLRKSRGENAEQTVEIGARVAGETNRTCFRLAGRPFVYAGKANELLMHLEKDPAGMRDRNLSRLGWRPLSRVRGEMDGTVFVLERQGDAWTVVEPEGMTADAIAVEDWFTAVRDLSIREFLDDADPAGLGLEEPAGRLTFWAPPKEGEDLAGEDMGEVAASLHLGRRTGNGVYARRATGDGGAFLVDPLIVKLIADGAWQFRSRRVFDFRPHDLPLAKIERAGAGGTTGTELVDGEWSNNAERVLVTALVDGLFSLSALRWVGPADTLEAYGLADGGEGSVLVTYGEGEGSKRFGVVLGKVTEGGRFARAIREGRPGEAIFLLPEASVNRLSAPLVK